MTKAMAYAAVVTLVLGTGCLLTPTGAQAAHAGAPYTNVDRSNDMGNDTGDSKAESLNSSQLDQNYHGPVQLRAPAGEPSTVLAPQSGEPAPVIPQTAPR